VFVSFGMRVFGPSTCLGILLGSVPQIIRVLLTVLGLSAGRHTTERGTRNANSSIPPPEPPPKALSHWANNPAQAFSSPRSWILRAMARAA
jgi:hypothetical protein